MTDILLYLPPILFVISAIPIIIVIKYLWQKRYTTGDVRKMRNILLVLSFANAILMTVEISIIIAVITKTHFFANDRLIALDSALLILSTANWFALIKTRNLRDNGDES